jgi:Collagen triple helix repeat (20 copies)
MTMTAQLSRPPRSRRTREGTPRWLPWALVAAVALVASLGWVQSAVASTAQTDQAATVVVADTAVAQRDATAGQAVDLATLVRERCVSGAIVDVEVCGAAAVVVAQPVPAVSGPVGPQGSAGQTGPAGLDGVPGLAPPCLTTPAQCVGPPGPAGPQGPAGVDGQDGAPGAAGSAGTPGSDGAIGPAGPAGADGRDGQDGAAGPAGRDGCDAGRDPDTGECIP